MKFYIKQRVLTLRDRFSIYDEGGREKYYVEGELLSFGKKLHLYEMNGYESAYLKQKVISFLPKYIISRDGADIGEVVKAVTFLRQKYIVNGLGWVVSGDFLAHEYEITDSGKRVAAISKKWLSFGDSYEIDIDDREDAVNVLSVVLIIDAIMDTGATSSASSSGR